MMSTTSEQTARGVITDSTVRASYEPSLTSSIDSSRISVFSDSSSTQSSTASSYSDDFRCSQDDTIDHLSLLVYERQQQQAKALAEQKQYEYQIRARQLTLPSYASITSTVHEQKQHPRRSLQTCDSRPPPLVRQSERKVNFVDNLVDSATQMVEVIWPLSVVPSVADARIGKGVLPLRTYIEETLRRSRTSYSTLQVALYYLILIKPFVPTCNFTMEQSSDCAATRALMCGRRMFLAALILASKYLQDRNYSAKAWSKMSGLGVGEINTNEKTFLEKANWQLHIPEMLFKRWTEIVLRYTPNVQFNTNPSLPETSTWKLIVPLLTPKLDGLPCTNGQGLSGDTACPAGEVNSSAQSYDFAVEKSPSYESLRSADTTPMPATIAPQLLQQRTDMLPPTPALLRMGLLPTPNMTPNSIASSTPAVSACGSRRSSLTSAMAFANRVGLHRCATDVHPAVFTGSQFPSTRGGSMYTEGSAFSSPESMLTDRSRNSRTSSVSSVSSSMALSRPCLARQATCRNAGLPTRIQEEKVSSLLKPVIFTEEMDLSSSPEMIDFRVSEKVLHMPHRHSKQMTATAQHSAASAAEKTRKRCRPRGGRRSNLQEEVRILLEEDMDSSMDLDHDESEASPSPTDLPLAFTLAADVRSDRISRQDVLVAAAHHARVDSAEQHEANKRRCFASSKLHLSALPQRTYLVS